MHQNNTSKRPYLGRRTLPRARRSITTVQVSIALVLFLGLATFLLASANASTDMGVADPADQVERAWTLVQQSNVYQFDTDIEQTSYPLPSLQNVGRTPQSDAFFLSGRRDQARDWVEMTVWQVARGSAENGMTLRSENGRTYRLSATGEWEEQEQFGDIFLPGGEPLTFLQTATNITTQGVDTRQLGDLTFAYDTYHFDLDTAAYARVLQQQMEAQLAGFGSLPPGMSAELPDIYRQITGSGALWLDGDGLPRRLEVTLEIPPQPDQGRVTATIVTDLSGFDRARIEQSAVPWLESPSAWLNLHQSGILTTAGHVAIAAIALLATGLFLFGILRHGHSRRLYLVVAGCVLTSMLVTPLLQVAQATDFMANVEAAQSAAAQRQEELQAQIDLQEAPDATDWQPNTNPLTTDSAATSAALSPQLAATSSITDTTDSDGDGLIDLDEAFWGTCPFSGAPENCTGVTDPTDTDGDGLSDGVEVHDLGTHPDITDSDADGIADLEEISGFDYNGKTWYLNPREADSNEDGLADGLECRVRSSIVADGFNASGICPDTDGDGQPDVFDTDNDGDNVPDDVDMSPFAASVDFYNQDNPLALSVDNLALNKPVFVDLQIRPDASFNLQLHNHVLDWPSLDGEGQIQRILDSTFADTDNLDLRSDATNAANGDIRLVPMLEITMPYTGGHYANLPITTTAPASRVLGNSVDTWLDSDQLTPYGISVNDVVDREGDLNAYLPVTQVSDRFGTPQAFAARMLYWPNQGTDGRAEWGAAHKVRLIWLVQIITDQCPAGYDDEREEEDDEISFTCVNPDTDATAEREDVLTIGHIYPDTWQLTGLTVSEEHDFDLAILYEDPAQDTDLTSDDQLMLTSWNLSTGFMIGRDCDSKDGNGICQGNGARDVTVENLATVVPSWFTDVDYLTIETYLDYDHGGYLAYLIGTEAEPLLDTHFGAYTDVRPTFMYVQDHTHRELNLDSLSNLPAAGLVTFSGDSLALDLAPADVPAQVKSSFSWTPYQNVNGAWQAAEVESYLTQLDTRLQKEAYFQPADESEAAIEEAANRRLWVQTYYASIWMGLSALTELAGQPLNTRATDPDFPDTEYDPFFTPGTDFGAIILATKFFEFVGGSGMAFLNSSGLTGVAVFTVLVLVTWTAIGLMASGNEKFERIGEIVLASLSLALGTALAINALIAISNGGLSAGTRFPAIGVAGVAIGLALTWGILLFTILTQDMSTLAINVTVSVAIATTLFTIFLVVLSVLGLGVLGILLFLVDAIFVLLDKKGPSQYIVEWLARLVFDVDVSVTNLDSASRLDVQVHEIDFLDEKQGFRETNTLFVTMGITNSIKYHRDLADKEDRVAKRNVFTYTLQTEQVGYEQGLAYWDDTATDQWTPLSGRKLQTSAENAITLPLAAVGAGVNQPIEDVYYTESFLTGAQSCWNVPTDQGTVQFCNWTKYRDAVHYPLSSMLTYDIFPETVTEFSQMRWSDTIPQLPRQVDRDADGISDLFGADPSTEFDGDNDGLGDLYEITNGYDPDSADGDLDGLTDAEELRLGTNPYLKDTDGDGLNDRIETVDGWLIVHSGNQLTRVWSDPLTVDADEDGLDDLNEFIFGFNPWTATDPSRILNLVQFDDLGVVEADAPGVLLRFEDAANSTAFYDSSEAGNHGLCEAGACPTLVADGRYRQALQFDGVDDYVTIPDSGEINQGLHPEHTISVWFRVEDATITERKQVIYEQGGEDRGLNLYVYDGQLYGGGWNVPDSESGWTGSFLTAPVVSGQWHHATLVLNGGSAITPDALALYLDGQSAGSDDGSQLWSHGSNVGIGARHDDTLFHDGAANGDGDYLAGRIDELVILNRAVTAGEVTELLNGRYNPDDNLLAPDTNLRYQATITNTSSTTATGFLVAENSIIDPEIPAPSAAFSFESEQRRAFFRNDSNEENRPYCFDAISCPTLGQTGQYGNGLFFDSDEEMLYVPTIDASADYTGYQIAFWLRVDSLPAAGQRAMILDTASTDPGALDIYLNDSGNLVWDIVGDPDSPRVSDYTFSLNQWTHVILYTHIQHFINGSAQPLVGDYWFGDVPPIKIGHGRLGNSMDGAEPFRGGIDELVYYEDGRTDRNSQILNGTYASSLGSYELLNRFDDAVNYDGTIFYNSRNGNHTTCTGGTCPLLTIESRGYSGRAIQFDGLDDVAHQSASNTYSSVPARSFSLYVKPTAYPSAGNIAYLYDASETDTIGDTRIIFDLRMDENGQLTLDYGWGAHTYTALDPLPLNEWTKITVSYERLFSPFRLGMTLALNDGSSSTVDICNRAIINNCLYQVRLSPGHLGNSADGSAPFTGLIDTVRFNAAALDFDTPFVDFGYENLASESRTSTCLFRAACPTITAGQFDDGLDFDGGDFLIVNTPLNPTKTDFTAGLWFKTGEFSNEPVVLQQEDRDGVGRTWLGIRADGRLYTFLGGSYLNSSSGGISADTWHHAAVSYDGANLRLYLDGALVAEEARAMESSRGVFWLGRPKVGIGNGYDRYFTGQMDELVIVPNRLADDALQYLMNSPWPVLDIPAEFEGVSTTALSSQSVSGSAHVSPNAATSLHRFDQEVEAALVLQAQIDYPIIDDNAANLEMYFPFEDGPGTPVFDNLISYPSGAIDPNLEGVCASAETCPTAGVRGQVGRAAYFDGQDDYLYLDASAYGTAGPNEVTAVSVWANAAQGTILDIDRELTGDSSTLEIDLGRILARDNSGNERTIVYDAPRNEWFHLVLTIDGSDQGTVYVNGDVVATGLLETFFDFEVRGYSIGVNNGGQDLLQGYLDDLRLYSTPLTQANVTALYERSAPLLRFEFDEDEAATRFLDNSLTQVVGHPLVITETVGGQAVSQLSPAPGIRGRIGNGALFDGQSYIQLDAADAPAALTNDFAIMAWIRPATVDGRDRIISAGTESSTDGYGFGVRNGVLMFHAQGVQRYDSNVPVEVDLWQHVAVVVDSNNDMHFYLNGQLAQTMSASAPIIANSDDPLYIGARVGGGGNIQQAFDGMIDELAVYGRALSEAELYGIYLRELRWYRDKATTYLTIDNDDPTIELLSDAIYRPDGYNQLAVATTDATAAVTLLDFGLKAPGASEFNWQGAPPCAEGDSLGGAWCPFFDSSQLGGEGEYTLRFRAVDAVGNETLSPIYTLYVDGTPPTAQSSVAGPQDMTTVGDTSWQLTLSGTLSDPNLTGTTVAGSGVVTDTVMVQLVDKAGGVASGSPQSATVDGATWSVDYVMSGIAPHGEYVVAISLEDVMGNYSTLAGAGVVLDERLPDVDVSPTSLPGVIISQTAVITGTASELPEWGNAIVEHHFEESAGATEFVNTTGYQAYTVTHTICAAFCPAAGQPSLFGSGVQFDGVDDALIVPYSIPVTFTLDAFAAAVWFNVGDLASDRTLLQQSDGSGTGDAWLMLTGDAGTLGTGLGGVPLTGSTPITPNAWHHAAVTYDGTTVRLYLNGRLEASAARTVSTSDGDWLLGVDSSGGARYDGLLDEFNLYESALTAEEVYGLAQSNGALATVSVALEPVNFTVTDTETITPTGWQDTPVDTVAANFSQWQVTLPADLNEGAYELYLRAEDANNGSGRPEMSWRGLIDLIAPRVTLTGTHIISGSADVTEFVFTLEDFMLGEGAWVFPCTPAPGELIVTRYNAPETPIDGLAWSVDGTCRLPGHQGGTHAVTACDLGGLCTTETVELEGPTAVTLADIAALAQPDGSVLVTWETATEIDNAGFNVYRSATPAFDPATATQLNAELIAAQAQFGAGAAYSFVDESVATGLWHYFLEDVELSGLTVVHGPVSADTTTPTDVGLAGVLGTSSNAAFTILALLAVALLAVVLLLANRRTVARTRP